MAGAGSSLVEGRNWAGLEGFGVGHGWTQGRVDLGGSWGQFGLSKGEFRNWPLDVLPYCFLAC